MNLHIGTLPMGRRARLMPVRMIGKLRDHSWSGRDDCSLRCCDPLFHLFAPTSKLSWTCNLPPHPFIAEGRDLDSREKSDELPISLF